MEKFDEEKSNFLEGWSQWKRNRSMGNKKKV